MIPGDTPASGTPPNDKAFIEEIKQRFERDIERKDPRTEGSNDDTKIDIEKEKL